MKTKHILTAMALPALFAACTADEIVDNNNVAVKRTEVPAVSFTAEGSRLAFENGAWAWEDTDKFLLLQADNGDTNTAATALPGDRFTAGKPSTGYEYAKGEDGSYTTKASVMEEGLYWGYAPSFNKQYKGYVKFELPTAQFMHVDGKVDTYKNPELAALVTPLYEVSALNEGKYYNQLPLEMVNFYSTLVLPFKNNTDEDITIKQIVFESEQDLTVAGRIKTDGKLANYIIASDGEGWAPKQNFNDDDEDDVTMAEFLDAMRKDYLVETYSKEAGDKQSKVIVLNLDGYVLEAGKTEEFYMLVPASGTEIDYSIALVAEEGLIEINHSYASNSMENTKIYHNAQKAAFGRTNKNVARSFVIDEKDFANTEGALYVTSDTEMMRILDEDVNGTISVYNVGDWGIDADLAKAIKNSDAFVIFNKDITVEGAALTAEKALELTKVAFDGEVIVKKNTKVNFNLGTYEPAEEETYSRSANKLNAYAAKMAIETGAEVALTSGEYFEITNKGTLTVAEGKNVTLSIDDAEITTSGVLNLKDEEPAAVTLNGGQLNYQTAKTGTEKWETSNEYLTVENLTADAEITVAKNVVLTHNAKNSSVNWRTLKPNSTTAYYTTAVTNKGTIKLASGANAAVNGDLHLYGKLTNEGVIESTTHTLCLHGASENKVNAKIAVLKFVNEVNAVMDNYGSLKKDNDSNFGNSNKGTINAYSGSRTEIDVNETVKGRINNTNHGIVIVSGDAQQIVYVEYDNVTVAELEAAEYETWGINTLRIKNGLDMTRAFAADKAADALGLAALTRLELADDASIFIKNKKDASTGDYVPVQVTFSEIVLEGDAEFYGDTEESSQLVIDNDVTIQMYNYAKGSANDKSCYALTLDNVTVTTKNGHSLTFAKTVNKTTATNENGWNVPVVKIEDATLCGQTVWTLSNVASVSYPTVEASSNGY